MVLLLILINNRTVRLRKIAPFLLFVILSGAKDLHFKPPETLRFAQSDSYCAACRPLVNASLLSPDFHI